jgi:hypothetical protein
VEHELIKAGHTERKHWRDLFGYRELSYFLAWRGGFAVTVILLAFPVFAWSADAESGAKQGFDFSVGEHGLDSLSFNGHTFLPSPKQGNLLLADLVFNKTGNTTSPKVSEPAVTLDRSNQTVQLSYSWGRISCAYSKVAGNQLRMRILVTNTTDLAIDALSVRLTQLVFPTAPQAGALEAGMFGFGFRGEMAPLYRWPYSIDSSFSVPILRIDYGSGALNFCNDDFRCSLGVDFQHDPAQADYAFSVRFKNIEPGATKTCDASFRFGSSGSSIQDLSADVLKRYADEFPFRVAWDDHRAIGAIYLASPGINVPTNPRCWIMNLGHLDVSTNDGKQAFRTALLKLADASVGVLQDCHAQGMITWDPEGQEFRGACYYGDPRLTPTLAPEMEFKGSSPSSTVDAYFQRFRAAGLKVGVCIRPQQIKMVSGTPIQQEADDEHAAEVLKDKIAYAKRRWGCTLFYIDSTVTKSRSLNPDVFKAVADAFPDVLLIPENESMRYFAYSAPLNSYQHHKITATPAGARLVYPHAFSVLLASEGDRAEDHQALVDSVRNGDILVFNCWYPNQGANKIKAIYDEAGSGDHGTTRP